jgi:hypothetical protein
VSSTYVPYRRPLPAYGQGMFQPQADTSLPFDPSMVAPNSPEELDSRQPVLQSQQSLQDALAAQGQAQQSHSFMDSPIFQLGVPAALTALTAIAPRHMGTAGPMGIAGFRTAMDANMANTQRKQTVAGSIAKQSQEDFNRQRLKYAIGNSNLDPSIASALNDKANIDVAGAASDLTKLSQQQLQHTAYGKATETFDPKQLPEGATQTFKDPMTDATTSFTHAKPDKMDPFSVAYLAAKEDPNFDPQAFVKQYHKDATNPPNPSPYSDYVAGHPNMDPGQRATQWQEMGNTLKTAKTDDTITQVVKGMMPGPNGEPPKIPVPLPSARGGMSPEMMQMYAKANELGFDMKTAQNQQLAWTQLTKTVSGQQWQGELKNTRVVEKMLDNTEALYKEWEPYASGFRGINMIGLKAAMQVPGPAGVAASNLHNAVTESRRALGVMLNSGAAITDEAGKAAEGIMRDDFPLEQMRGAFAVARSQTQMREWALNNPVVPDVSPTGEQKPSPPLVTEAKAGPATGKYKTKEELDRAYENGSIGLGAAKAIAKKNGWTQ